MLLTHSRCVLRDVAFGLGVFVFSRQNPTLLAWLQLMHPPPPHTHTHTHSIQVPKQVDCDRCRFSTRSLSFSLVRVTVTWLRKWVSSCSVLFFSLRLRFLLVVLAIRLALSFYFDKHTYTHTYTHAYTHVHTQTHTHTHTYTHTHTHRSTHTHTHTQTEGSSFTDKCSTFRGSSKALFSLTPP